MSKLPDDVPNLVESSDDEGTLYQVGNGYFAREWLKQPHEKLDSSDRFIKNVILGPFLFGIGYGVEKPWIEALYSAKIILTKNREKDVTVFTEDEEEMIVLIEKLVDYLQPKLRQKSYLRCALEIVHFIEKGITNSTGELMRPIDRDKAIEIASSFPTFLELVQKISGSEKLKLKREGQFAMIFIFKNYHSHVVGYCKDAKVVEDEIKEEWKKKNDLGMSANACKEKGNEAFRKDDMKKAIKYYSYAIAKDPLNHKYYGNRSLANYKLEKYRESFCDGKRAVSIEPKWEKGYYRCTEAALELKLFHVAMEYNQLGRKNCPETASLYEQEKKIKEAIKSSHEEKKLASKSKGEESRTKEIKYEMGCKSEKMVPELTNKTSGKKGKISGKRSRPETPMIDSTANKENVDHAALLNDIPALLSDHDSDEGKQKTKKSKKKKKKKVKSEESMNIEHYRGLLKQGSEAYLECKYTVAVQYYQQSLDYLYDDNKLERSIEEMDIVVLKYSYGMASIGIGVYKSVCNALNKFLTIQEVHCNVRFPPVYYGIAKSLVELHRYSEAIEPCKSGLKAVKNGVKCGQLLWPGLTDVIPLTDNKVLEKCLNELLLESCYPPLPDAVCRFHHQDEAKQTSIYFSDLNFKGFIKVECLSNCCICFHNNCWKFYKNSFNISSDKEMLNTECPTPDCCSIIYRIVIIQQDSTEKSHTQLKDIPLPQKLYKPIINMKPCLRTIQRRQERKLLRKKRQQEAKISKRGENQVNGGSPRRLQKERSVIRSPENKTNFDISERDVIILKKEGEEEYSRVRNKSSKSKKKKKVNHIVNVEVNFNDRRNENLFSSTTDFDSIDSGSQSSEVPFSVPTSLQSAIEEIDRDYNNSSNTDVLSNPAGYDSISLNLFGFFADILEAHGPLQIFDKILQLEIAEFPPEAKEVIQKAGGLRNFLKQSLKFAMIEDHVCVLKDAVKARELSMKKNRNNNANQVPSVTSFQTNKSSSSRSVASLADITLPPSLLAKTTTKVPTPLPLPTKLREPAFDPEDSKCSSVSSSAKPPDVNVWMEKTEKRKSAKIKEVKTINEKFVSELIVSQKSERRKKSPKTKYNNLDDFEIPCDAINSSDGLSDVGISDVGISDALPCDVRISDVRKEKRISDLDDFNDNENFSQSQSPKTSDINAPSESSSVSDVSEQSDISLDLLYRTASPSSVSSRASTIPHHLQQLRKDSPLSLPDSHPNSPSIPPNITSSLHLPSAHLFQNMTQTLPTGSPSINGKLESVDPDVRNKMEDNPLPPNPSSSYNFTSSWQSQNANIGSVPAPIGNRSKLMGYGSAIIPPNPLFSSTYSDSDSEKIPSNPWAVSTNNVFESPVHPNSTSDWSKPKRDQNFNQSSLFSPVLNKESKMADIMLWNQNNPTMNQKLIQAQNFSKANEKAVFNTDVAHGKTVFDTEVTNRKTDKWIQTERVKKQDCGINTELDINSLLLNNKKLIEDNQILYTRLNQIQGLNQKSDIETTAFKVKIENLESVNQTLSTTLDKRNHFIKGLMEALSKRDNDVSEIHRKHSLLINDQDNSQIELQKLTDANILISDKLDILTQQCHNNIDRARTAEITVLKTRLDLSLKSFNQIKKEAMFHIEHLNRLVHKCAEDKTPIPQQASLALEHWKGIVEISDEKFQKIKMEFEGQIKLIEEGKKLSELPPIAFSPPPLPPPQTAVAPNTYNQGRGTPTASILSPITPPTEGFTTVAPPNNIGTRPQTFQGHRPQLPSMPKSVWPARNPKPRVGDPKTSMEKLIIKLQEVFPRYDVKELKEIILELRKVRGGRLSGISLPAIIHYVTEKLSKQHGCQDVKTRTVAPPPGLHIGLSSPSSELFTEDEDPCAICTDDLSQQPVRVLECKHSFHEMCIKQWFNEQKTCPTCRGYALLPDEYPSLK